MNDFFKITNPFKLGIIGMGYLHCQCGYSLSVPPNIPLQCGDTECCRAFSSHRTESEEGCWRRTPREAAGGNPQEGCSGAGRGRSRTPAPECSFPALPAALSASVPSPQCPPQRLDSLPHCEPSKPLLFFRYPASSL